MFLSCIDSVPLLQVDSSKVDLDIRATRSATSIGLYFVLCLITQQKSRDNMYARHGSHSCKLSWWTADYRTRAERTC